MDTAVQEKLETFRTKIVGLEIALKKHPKALVGDSPEYLKVCPLKHTFVDGAYVRELFMPKGMLFVTKIHKVTHPYFLMKGDCSVLTEDGIKRIKAPFSGITKAGTKRIIYTHADTVWITVHTNPDNGEDLEKIEERHIAKTFDELNIIDIKAFVVEAKKGDDNALLLQKS